MTSKLLAFLLIALLFPVLTVISALIYFFDGNPIFYKQQRIGKNNIKFTFYKFRTMKNNLGDIPTHELKNSDSKLTKSGAILRKYSFDELPQLINILKGEMSFIGPRPALHNQNDLITKRTNLGVHKINPGVTGWAQVNGRDMLSISQKVKLDHYYYLNKSIKMNFIILIRTFLQIISPKGVSH